MTKVELVSLFEKATSLWNNSKYAVAFTGAGISVPSGIPDFRSPGGLWSKYDPVKVASSQALEQNPKEVWEFILETIQILENATPNPAHIALAKLEKQGKLQTVITQNVDNLHQRSGSNSVVEFHGNLQRFYCQKCLNEILLESVKKISHDDIPLLCPSCNNIIRPDVVFFGESIPQTAFRESNYHINKADLILIAGTSGEVAPANILPREVKRNNGKVIEINLGDTYYSDITDVRFNAPVEEILPQLADMIL